MPYRNFTLKQIACYLGLNIQEAEKLAQKGELPGERICGSWRFNKIRTVEWLQQTMHTLSDARLKDIEAAMGNVAVDDDSASTAKHLVVTELIGLSGITVKLPARTRKSVLIEMVNLSDATGLLYDCDGLIKALEERENLCSTAIPGEIAIPHPRRPLPYATAEPLICVGRTGAGIGFGAPDGKLSRLFFLICCHDDSHHLHVLARLMRMLDPATIRRLLVAPEPREILEILIVREDVVIAAGT
jgi:PTS system nitrogen regulatory IIA component